MSTPVSETCQRCRRPLNAECGGRGTIPISGSDNTVRQCPNMQALELKRLWGPEISSVKHVPSPLYTFDPVTKALKDDLTKQNLWIKTQWPGLLPHLKWVLFYKGPMFRFRIVTDTRIKSVFVGDEQYKSRPAHLREDAMTFNSLQDLLGEDIDLAIIKLGYLGHKNKAAAGALLEALLVRDACRKPTWIIEDTRDGYEWNHSRSNEVEDFVGRFDEIEIEPVKNVGIVTEESEAKAAPKTGHGIVVDDGDEDPLPAAEPIPVSKVKAKPRPRPEPAPEPEEPRASSGGDPLAFLDGKPKFGGNRFKKKGGGW